MGFALYDEVQEMQRRLQEADARVRLGRMKPSNPEAACYCQPENADGTSGSSSMP